MEEEAAPPPPPPPVPPLLPFDDAWQLRTRPSTFEGVVAPGEIVSLNHIRCGGVCVAVAAAAAAAFICRHTLHTRVPHATAGASKGSQLWL